MKQIESLTQWQELIELIRNEISQKKYIQNKTAGKNYPFYLLILYFRIIDLSNDLQKSIKNGMFTSVPLLFRSLIETSIDFINLKKDDQYYEILEFESLKNDIKYIKNYIEHPENPYLAKIEGVNMDVELQKNEETLAALKKKGIKKLNIKDKFKKTDKGQELYQALYNFLCQDTHGDINKLKADYFSVENGKWCLRNPDKKMNYKKIYAFFDSNIRILVSTSRDINIHFDLFDGNIIEKISSYLSILQ